LTDYVVAELLVDFLGCWYLAGVQTGFGDSVGLFLNDFTAQINTLITNIDTTRASDQSLHLILALAAKGAAIC
jgi:hypothetical protein